jgi:hypothetical protein
MPNRLTFILSLLVLISCSENKSGKMKDLESIRSKSTYQHKKKMTTVERGLDTLLAVYNQDSVELTIQSIENDTNRFFFQEFNPLELAQFNLIDASNHALNHQYVRYKPDSIYVKNHFFNWFDQTFCQRNLSIRIYKRDNLYPGNIFFVCTNQSIHVVKSETKIDPMKWLKLIQRTEEKVEFIYICHQKKNKPALWYTFKQNKLILIPAQ